MTPKTARIAFIIFFCAIVAAFLYMAAPLMKGAFLAFIVAVLFYPVYLFFLRIFRHHNYIAAIVTTIISFAVVLIPLTIVLTMIASHLFAFVSRLSVELQSGQLDPAIDRIGNIINHWLVILPGTKDAAIDLQVVLLNFVKHVGKFLYQYSPNVFASTVHVVITLVVVVIFLVVFLAEGSRLFAWFMRLFPLSRSHQEEISREIRVMISATLLGMIATALIQGVLIGLGFLVAGFEEPVMWGLIAVLAAFIPIIGAAVCYLGGFSVLLAMGRWQAAVIFLAYGLIFVSSVDNIIKPLVMGSQVRIHPVLLFVALLGGVRAFGPIGIVFGPVLLAVFLSALKIYQREFA